MSEFKFACPVCGQHITADSSNSGGQIECPTCFQKIVVPQAASPESKFILSASQVGKPRPASTAGLGTEFITAPASRSSWLVVGALVLTVAAAGAAAVVFRDRIFSTGDGESRKPNPAHQNPSVTPPIYSEVPTNIPWSLDLARAILPDAPVTGGIHDHGFACERATLQGGSLSLRQGRTWPPDLGVSIQLFAQQGEDLSNKSIEIGPDRTPPLPKVVLRWKDAQGHAQTRTLLSGYALKLSFGPANNGRIPGRMYLATPDPDRSFVAGTFDAEIRRANPPRAKQPKPTVTTVP